MKKQFVYFREFSKNNELNFDFTKITLKERLFFSAILTKVRQNDERDLGEIIFDYDGSRTGSNFASYDNVNTKMIMKEYGKVFDYITSNANKRTKENWKIHAINIDINKVFLTRNGHTANSMNAIACKTFALAAASSRCSEKEWRTFDIYEWCEIGDKVDRKTLNTRKTKIKARIQKWLDAVGIKAHFDNNYCVIDGMKDKEEVNHIEVEAEKEMPNEVKKMQIKEAPAENENDKHIAEIQARTLREIAEKRAAERKEERKEEIQERQEMPKDDLEDLNGLNDLDDEYTDIDEILSKDYDHYCHAKHEIFGLGKNPKILAKVKKATGFNYMDFENRLADKLNLGKKDIEKYLVGDFIPDIRLKNGKTIKFQDAKRILNDKFKAKQLRLKNLCTIDTDWIDDLKDISDEYDIKDPKSFWTKYFFGYNYYCFSDFIKKSF